MRNKPADIPYCGVDEQKIKNAKPILNMDVVKLQNDWIFERYRIKKRKDSGAPRPWTDNWVLQEYRFCNVRREDDRESQYLIQNISENPTMDFENKFYNTILFRMFNKWETIVKLGGVLDWHERPDLKKYNEIIEAGIAADPDYVWYTNAYIIGGQIRATETDFIMTSLSDEEFAKLDLLDVPELDSINDLKVAGHPETFYIQSYNVDKVLELQPHLRPVDVTDSNNVIRTIKRVWQLKQQKFFEKIISCPSPKEVYNIMNKTRGFGKFMSNQIMVDYAYIPEYPFSENEWVVAGPGSENGMKLLFDDFDGLSFAELLFWQRDNLVQVWKDNGLDWDLNELFEDKPEYDRCLNLALLQNSSCELSKYVRTVRGAGRPKVKYVPFDEHGQSLEEFF